MTAGRSSAPKFPDFEPGNKIALKHGAWSLSTIDPIAAEIVEQAVVDAPYLGEVRYRATLLAWAREEARCRVLNDYLERNGLLDAKGRLRGAESALHRAETRAANLRRELGLTPMARARLGRAVQEQGPSIYDPAVWADDNTEGSA